MLQEATNPEVSIEAKITNGMLHIHLCDLQPNHRDYSYETSKIISHIHKGEKIEYLYNNDSIQASISKNQLIGAMTESFSHHLPFVLNPNDIWLTIIQNLSAHINANVEKFRGVMVDFDGKKKITIDHNGLVMGNPYNDWSVVFPKFQEKITSSIKDPEIANKIVSPFSNSGFLDITCFQVALMDFAQGYFDYGVRTMCGIPDIYIDGKKEDWEKIIENVKYLLPKFELPDWMQKIVTIVSKIIEAYDSKIDTDFFNSMYKYRSMSGGDTITGWIRDLFIYKSKEGKVIPRDSDDKMSSDNCLPSLSVVPFEWDYFGTPFGMKFYAGIVGFNIEKSTNLVRTNKNFFITHTK